MKDKRQSSTAGESAEWDDRDVLPVGLPPSVRALGPIGDAAWAVYDHVEAWSLTNIRWYLRKKRKKARGSRVLRVGAIIFAVAGGLIPLLALQGVLAAAWGYVPLGLAAACVALDRLLGYSSSWMRYAATALELEYALASLQVAWMSTTSCGSNGELTSQQYDTLMASLKTHVDDVGRIVREETSGWTADFSARLADLDRSAQSDNNAV